MNNTTSKSLISQAEQKAIKIADGESYLPYNILKEIVKDTDIPKRIIEEQYSELFCETLNGTGKIIFTNDMQYYGSIKNGILESNPAKASEETLNKKRAKLKKREYELIPGKSIIIFPDGTKYEGDVKNNKISGEGKYFFTTGATYSGSLENGLRDGKGTYISQDQSISYIGDWKKGVKHGKGQMKRPGMEYEGEFENGNIHGTGKIKWDNGNIYEGKFKNNGINGNGYMIWYEMNEKYVGNWVDNKQDGKGIHIWFENKGELKEMKNRYVGEWKKGQRNGYGVFFYSNGAYYEGEWKNNMKQGFGVMTFQDGRRYVGRFEEDRLLDQESDVTENMMDRVNEECEKAKEEEAERRKIEEERKKDTLNLVHTNSLKDDKDGNKSLNSTKSVLSSLSKTGNKKVNVKIMSKDDKDKSKAIQSIKEDQEENENESMEKSKMDKKALKGESNRSKERDSKNLSKEKDSTNNLDKTKSDLTNRQKNKDNKSPKNQFGPSTKSKKFDKTQGTFDLSRVGNTQSYFLKNTNTKFAIQNDKKFIAANDVKYRPFFDIDDLILEDPSIVEDFTEISNVILRNLSQIKKLYTTITRTSKSEGITDESNVSKMIVRDDLPQETLKLQEQKKVKKNAKKPASLKRSHTKTDTEGEGLTTNNEMMVKIDESVRNDDISFAIKIKDVWLFLRENGIINDKISIADFDRIYKNGSNIEYETFQVPEQITNEEEVFRYINKMITDSRIQFMYKYNKQLKYYYRDSEIPDHLNPKKNTEKKEFIEHSLHDKNQIVLLRHFYECLVRVAYLYFYLGQVTQREIAIFQQNYLYSSFTSSIMMQKKDVVVENIPKKIQLKLSQKLQFLLDMLIPKKQTKSKVMGVGISSIRTHSKIEQSLNTTMQIAENKAKVQEVRLYNEFYSLFAKELHEMFNKVYEVYCNIYNETDKTIQYSYFYRKIIQPDEGLKKIIPNRKTFIECINYFFKENKITNIIDPDPVKQNQKRYEHCMNLYNREMTEYEFDELIFVLSKKYFAKNNKKGVYTEYKEFIYMMLEIINKLEKVRKKKYEYCYPELSQHRKKQKLIDEEKERIENERKRKVEIERFTKERENMDKEKECNAYNEDELNEEDEEDLEDEDEF